MEGASDDHGLMFMSLSTLHVFKSYRDNGRMIMIGSLYVQLPYST